MATLMSFIALSIDVMLPALGVIGRELKVQNPNDVQLIVSSIFLGMGIGLTFFGPLSDSFGRKPTIYLGMFIFLIGCLASIFSSNFEVMLFGRLLQGLGGASCRVTTLSIIRDRFEGREMAKIMSFVTIFFILVPALAPSLGQLILLFFSWRSIFALMFVMGILSVTWLALGLPETLVPEKRLPFSVRTILNGARETLSHRASRRYTLASGFVFGAFIGYISSAQQVLQEQYQLGERFSLVFGFMALAIGVASFANSKWVDRYGMVNLCKKALVVLVSVAALFLPYSYLHQGHPPLFLLVGYLMVTFFCCGILFGNFNALAIQPLGHIAGVANSVISSLQTLMSVGFGGFVGYSYSGTILPIVSGFLILGGCALLLIIGIKEAES